MHTLVLCIGMFMGACGQLREFDFPNKEACNEERKLQEKYVGKGYATCVPTDLNKKNLFGKKQ